MTLPYLYLRLNIYLDSYCLRLVIPVHLSVICVSVSVLFFHFYHCLSHFSGKENENFEIKYC